jgi:mannose-6-phosphate isomerase-like protein (cupin superfamily)
MPHNITSALASHVGLSPFYRRIEKPWGSEVIWAESGSYTGKLLNLRAGHRLSLQYHDEKLETQCLLSGRALLIIDVPNGEFLEMEMTVGTGYTIEPYRTHRLAAIDDSVVIEVSTPERGTTVRVQDDYCRPNESESIRALPNRGWTDQVIEEIEPAP